MRSPGEITALLEHWDQDRQSALEILTPIVYGELRRIAAAYLRRERFDHTLQPTALINEAYIRLVKPQGLTPQNRSHFFALAARMMRQILVDGARASRAGKRGSGNKLQLDEKMELGEDKEPVDFLVVHEALDKLEDHNPRMAQVVELFYFGGLSREEIAETLTVSLGTVKRDLALGIAWLRRALSVAHGGGQ